MCAIMCSHNYVYRYLIGGPHTHVDQPSVNIVNKSVKNYPQPKTPRGKVNLVP